MPLPDKVQLSQGSPSLHSTALGEMADDPKPLERPLVILAGWGDPGFADKHIMQELGRCVDDERIIRISFGGTDTFDECRARVVETIDAEFPGDDPEWTVEVDIVANSLGGVIAAYAGVPAAGQRNLRIVRLFAIAAPFRGTKMAGVPTTSQILIDLRPGSEFLAELNDPGKTFDYELIPYARLGDTWVGLENTAPLGEVPWWVPNRAFQAAHMSAYTDPRFMADMARRLRGETPFTTEPRAPPPE